jgi:hypothetical protein
VNDFSRLPGKFGVKHNFDRLAVCRYFNHYPSLSQRIIEIMIFMFPVDTLLIGGPAFQVF